MLFSEHKRMDETLPEIMNLCLYIERCLFHGLKDHTKGSFWDLIQIVESVSLDSKHYAAAFKTVRESRLIQTTEGE